MRRAWLFLLIVACTPRPSPSTTAPDAPVEDPIAVYDAVETAIAAGSDSEQQRVDALAKVERTADDGSAGYAFVRAALNGRVAELRGANAGKLVTEAERWARESLARDPKFRDGAATQMLGSLYVMAPGRLVEHGDSEEGLEMLEGLVAAQPTNPRYRMRLAQAFDHLGDPDAGKEHLCVAAAGRDQLPGDEQKLLDKLLASAGGLAALSCPAS